MKTKMPQPAGVVSVLSNNQSNQFGEERSGTGPGKLNSHIT